MVATVCLALPAADLSPVPPDTPWFGVQTQDRVVHQRCDLRLNSICGCTHNVDIDYWHECKSSNRKKSNVGDVCDGTWSVSPGESDLDHFFFEKTGCKAECTLGAAGDTQCFP
ncbi:MAG: hypothetical protein Q9203_007530 [Teloschistes exilis]